MNRDLNWTKFVKEGDKASFSLIYDDFVDKLFAYGVHLGFSSENCKDAIQDVFVKLFSDRDSLARVTNPTAYLFRSLKHRLVDIYRKEDRQEAIDKHSGSFSVNVTVLDHLIDSETARNLKIRVENLLTNLTHQQREAVYLRYMLELSYDEIGELLSITPESARKLMYRALEKLRGQFDDQNSEIKALIYMIVLLNL